jgi:hypothetical protein
MSKAVLPRVPVENWEAQRAEWIGAVERLIADVEAWATKRGWWIQREDKTVSADDDRIGVYQAPMLRIQTPTSRLIMEPIARYVVGACGRVDLAVFPSYHSVAVVRRDKVWQIDALQNRSRPRPWSEQAFMKAVDHLASKA